MKKLFIFAAAGVIVMAAGVISYLLFTGPRMYVQPNIRAFQAVMPDAPSGTVPTIRVVEPVPSKDQIRELKNPLEKTPENYAKGKIYYNYYCVFCHGDKGDGFGPVGFSYNPVPSDLRTTKVQSLPDGQLLSSMLTGTGHSPMLERIVPLTFRWYIVLYVRQFAIAPDTASLLSAGTPPKGPDTP